MNYAYYGTGGIRKMLYQDIERLSIADGLVLLERIGGKEPYTFLTTYAIIRLGDGERLVKD